MLLGVEDMERVAVFVDAGYLFAQSAIEMFGKKLQRGEMVLDHFIETSWAEEANPAEP